MNSSTPMTVPYPPVILTPSSEPYRGRPVLVELDRLICSTLELSNKIAPRSHGPTLSDEQYMAGQLIAQGLSLAQSIRDLIRQGHLFGGAVLVRPLMERAVMLLYLFVFPEEIGIWNRGWNRKEAPDLARMIRRMQ